MKNISMCHIAHAILLLPLGAFVLKIQYWLLSNAIIYLSSICGVFGNSSNTRMHSLGRKKCA